MENKSVCDTGPIMHLSEINIIFVLEIFSQVIIPPEVESELKHNKILISRKMKIIKLNSKSKDIARVIINQYDLDFGEGEAISLALREKVKYFLTDDLDARIVAKNYNLEVHGSIGLILRAFREKIISKIQAINKIKEPHLNSSLYITKDLVNIIIGEITKYSKK